ncbi:serine/threonine-protein kinase [Paenibacillus humicus]|uniref:serine/threonine-protein kinase n=1 Tax=Paenibacillus humicus TaxID=412861 RepID=UPI0013E40083|nr:serine/threonine-protein kinase [Paenibacillus humicus]
MEEHTADIYLNRDGLAAGSLVGGRYRVAAEIGRGGMSRVYAVEDTRLNNKLRALKINAADRAALTAEEAFMLMRLEHPHLPQLLDYYPPSPGSGEMLVMDYIDGQTLQQAVMARGRGLELHETAAISLQLCSALSYLHRQQPPVIHRDLKPSNVMIDKEGRVRLIDFGIARSYKPGSRSDTRRLGTPGFAAPEQESGGQSDSRTDVYGLGRLVRWLMLGGECREGFHGRRAGEVLPPWLLNMLERRPEDRLPSMEEAAREIRLWADSAGAGLAGNGKAAALGLAGGALPGTVSVLSLSPGSGATFLSLMLARYLEEKGRPFQLIEAPGGEPEYCALIGSPALPPAPDGPDPRYRRLGGVRGSWQVLHPEPAPAAAADQDARFRLMASGGGEGAVIVDWSSRWHEAALAEEWASGSGLLVVCADPNPARWSTARIAALNRLLRVREAAGLRTVWAACKDAPFPERAEWLAMLPEKPAIVIPYLEPSEWYALLWEGMPLPRKGNAAAALRQALGALSALLPG